MPRKPKLHEVFCKDCLCSDKPAQPGPEPYRLFCRVVNGFLWSDTKCMAEPTLLGYAMEVLRRKQAGLLNLPEPPKAPIPPPPGTAEFRF